MQAKAFLIIYLTGVILAYTLPVWAGWVGTAVLAMAILLLWRAHVPPAR